MMMDYKLYDKQVKAIEGRNTKYQFKDIQIYRHSNIGSAKSSKIKIQLAYHKVFQQWKTSFEVHEKQKYYFIL